MKKIVSIILALIISLSCFSFFAFAAEENYPVEAKFSENGEYKVKTVTFDSGEEDYEYYKVWYPAELENSTEKYPIIIYNNSSGMTDDTKDTINMMTAFASWGFVGLSNDHTSTGNGDSASKGLDFLISLSEDEESIFYGKLDLDAVGVCGHSQGGSASINAASEGKYENSHMFSSICTISAPHSELAASDYQKTPYDASKVKVPAFLIGGTKSDEAGYTLDSGITPLGMGLIANMKAIDNENVIIGRITDAWHVDTQSESQPYVIAWFCWTLMGDEFAATAFTGDDAELYRNIKWQDVYNKQSTDLPENPDPYDAELVQNLKNVFGAISEFFSRLMNFIKNLFKF